MDGDQKTQTPESGWQYKPVDNPPSLSEPSQRTVPVAPPAEDTKKAAAPAPTQVAPATEFTDPYAEGAVDEDFADPLLTDADDPEEVIEWTSSGEELQTQTSAWRLRMTLVSLVAAGIIYALSRDVVSTGAVVVAGLLFAFLGSRKPPTLNYKLDRTGITIGQKYYSYNEFRAFSVAEDMRAPTIDIVPLKRFLPLLSLHYDLQQRDKIVELLANHLPLEIHRRDALDSIINRVKF